MDYFASLNNIGGMGCLRGEWDKIQVNIFVVKEPD